MSISVKAVFEEFMGGPWLDAAKGYPVPSGSDGQRLGGGTLAMWDTPRMRSCRMGGTNCAVEGALLVARGR